MSSEAQDGPEPQDAAGEAAEDADAISRLEQALERIDRQAQTLRADGPADSTPLAEIAGRLDALIAQLRTALAERPGED